MPRKQRPTTETEWRVQTRRLDSRSRGPRRVFVVSLTVACGLWLAAPADACSCLPSPTPCAGVGSSTTIFVGTPIARESFTRPMRVVRIGRPNVEETLQRPMLRFTFTVAEALKGPVRAGATMSVVTPPDADACGFPFVEGTRYLVYGSDDAGQIATGLCSRTRREAAGGADLALLRETKIGTPVSRLTGQVMQLERQLDGSFEDPRPERALSRIPITTTGPDGKRHETRTDRRGRFTFAGLRPGRYTVTPSLRQGRALEYPEMATVTLDDCPLAEVFMAVVSCRPGSPAAFSQRMAPSCGADK